MQRFKAIGFDWGGVIYGQSSVEYLKDISKILNIEPEIYKNAHWKHNYLVNINSFTREQFWKVILKDLHKENSFAQILSYLDNRPPRIINKKVVEIIKELKEKGYKLGILSNHTIDGGNKIRSSEVFDFFDTILVSAEIGFMKPQVEAFNLLIEKLGIKPGELIFVDDTEKSLSTSKEIGYTPLLYTSPRNLTLELKKLGI